MQTFRDTISEMAVDRGMITKSENRRKEWEHFLDDNKTELLRDRIGSNHYKLYKHRSVYFLTGEDDDYRGFIEFDITKDYHIIKNSGSELSKGFYAIMFTSILSTGVKEIVSDYLLSTNAIKSYENLSNSHSSFNIAITDGNQYLEYNKEVLLSDKKYRVSIKEKHDLNELFEDFYERIEKSYKKSYDERTEQCDWFLFGNLDDTI